MQRILIIAENSLQQQRLCAALNFDRGVRLTTANPRQIHSKNIEALKQSDLIILEDAYESGGEAPSREILALLKVTGLPIILLPTPDAQFSSEAEPLILNLTEESVTQPGLVALINKIRGQYSLREGGRPFEVSVPIGHAVSNTAFLEQGVPPAAMSMVVKEAESSPERFPSSASLSSVAKSGSSSKITHDVLVTITRISNQLREPLSNINLAIHMLGRVQSIEERDRYVRLLREEYQRELQLVNELENLRTSLEMNL